MTTYEFISVLLIAFGMFLIYACVQLKVSGVPTKGVLISSRINFKNAKDPEGFKNYIYGRCIAIGAGLMVVSFIAIVLSKTSAGPILNTICMILLLGICIYYTKIITDAQKRYVLGMDLKAMKAKKKEMKLKKKEEKKRK